MIFKISIIIPAYNSEKYIEKTLNSIINQTIDNIEIIVIVNGSNDRTYDYAEKILKNQNKYQWKVIREKEGNVGKARNIGIKKASGEYLYFIDSDDLIFEDALEKMYLSAINQKSEICFCGYNRIDENGKILAHYEKYFNYLPKLIVNGIDALNIFLFNEIWICTGSAIYKRDYIIKNDILFHEKFNSGEDQYFVVKALYFAEKVTAVNKVFFNYVIHDKSLSISKDVFDSIEVFKVILQFFNKEAEKILNAEKKDRIKNLSDIVEKYKIPYLKTRAYYRISKIIDWKNFKKMIKLDNFEENLKIYSFNLYSLFTILGYNLLKYTPFLFYKISRIIKK